MKEIYYKKADAERRINEVGGQWHRSSVDNDGSINFGDKDTEERLGGQWSGETSCFKNDDGDVVAWWED